MRHRLRACTSVRAWDPGDCRHRALLCRGRDSGGPWCRVPVSVLLAQPLRKRRCTWPAALMGVDGVHAILCGGEEQPPPLVSIAVRRWLLMQHGLLLGPHPHELEEVFNRGHCALGSAHNRRRSPGGLSVRLASTPCSLVSQSSHPSFPAILPDLNGIFLYLNGIFFGLNLNGVLFFLLIPKAGRQAGRRLRLTRSGVRRSSTGLARGHSPAPGSSRVARRDPTCCSRLREVRADRSRSASPESGRHPQELE